MYWEQEQQLQLTFLIIRQIPTFTYVGCGCQDKEKRIKITSDKPRIRDYLDTEYLYQTYCTWIMYINHVGRMYCTVGGIMHLVVLAIFVFDEKAKKNFGSSSANTLRS